MSPNSGELDNLITSVHHARFITCPVFGSPSAAEKGLLIAVMSGDYRAKKDVAYLLVPAAARKVIDLGGNIEKGLAAYSSPQHPPNIFDSSKVQTFRKFFDPRDYGSDGRVFDPCRKSRCRFRHCLDSFEWLATVSSPRIHRPNTHNFLELFPAPMYALILGEQSLTEAA